MRFHLIVNPQARMYRRDATLLAEVEAIGRGRAKVHVTRDLDELALVADQLAHEDPDVVMLSGGDGSLMAGVTALARALGDRQLPAIAPLPGGTAGTIARNWGIAGDPREALRRILRGPRRYRPHPSLAVVGALPDGRRERRIGFIVGRGLVARFFRVYYDDGARGYSGSAKLVARIFAESFVSGPLARQVLEPLPCRLVVDGEELEPPAWSLICSAVIRNLGIHMLLTHRAAEHPRRPHVVATPMLPRQLGPRAPLVLLGRPIGGPGNVDTLAEEFSIRFEERGPYVLDGELLSAQAVHVRAGPMIKLVLPA